MRELDGHQVFGFFRAGAERIQLLSADIDRINVFPVPDGDTGANLSLTLGHAVATAQVHASAAATLGSLAESALVGARGNAGVIFAQFVVGLAEAIGERARVDMERFAQAVHEAQGSAWRAVQDPREGTMLTVIRAWAEALRRHQALSPDFPGLLRASHPTLEESLAGTRDQLEALRAAGVVDAGALGFVVFVEGGKAYLEAGAPRLEAAHLDLPAPVGADHGWELGEDPRSGPRYCTEFLLEPRSGDLDLADLRRRLAGLGDSLIVAGGGRRARVHLHCLRPARALDCLLPLARVRSQKVEDMHRQYADARTAHGRVALVTDSTCDLPPALLDRHGIHVVPLTLRFGEEEFLDRLTLEGEAIFDRMAGSPVPPATSQPPPLVFERLYRSLLPHYDQVLSLHLSGRLSGTCASAQRAAEAVDPARVRVVDTRHLSGSLGLLVLEAARRLEAGAPAEAVLEALPGLCDGARILVSVRSLDAMVRSGRVSPLKGLLARALNLKPIVSVDREGASRLHGKAFSVEANLRKILRMAAEAHAARPVGSWAVVHGGDPEAARDLALRVEPLLGRPPEHVSPISAVIGLSAGQGAVALATLPA